MQILKVKNNQVIENVAKLLIWDGHLLEDTDKILVVNRFRGK